MKLPLEMHLSDAQKERMKRAAGEIVDEATRVLAQRDSSGSSSGSSSSCTKGTDSGLCETPSARQGIQNVAIAMGVVVPLLIAAVILAVLHRRLRKKQKQEDLHDPHKSLDFGMDGVEPAYVKRNKSRKEPEMSVQEISGHGKPKRTPGLSLDMNIGSPYMLPPGMNGSHESIHSLARTHDDHDPYRSVALLRPSTDGGSIRTGRFQGDNGSLYSMSTGHHSALADKDKAGLLVNARPMSQTWSKRGDSMSPENPASPTAGGDFPLRQMNSSINRTAPPPIRKPSLDKNLPEILEKEVGPRDSPSIVIDEPQAPAPLAKEIAIPEPVAKQMPPAPRSSDTTTTSSLPSRGDSMLTTDRSSRPESSNYGDEEPTPLAPLAEHHAVTVTDHDAPYDIDPIMIYTEYGDEPPSPNALPQRKQSLAAPHAAAAAGSRLSVMGLRPLPPDMPDDNPEVRANRIRSFYKEYFDDSKPQPANAQYTDPGYYYDDGYMDGIIYDPETGGFYAPGAQTHAKPWAQGPARRAMTPPPRARPRVSDNSSVGYQYHSRRPSLAYSTMSGGGPRGRPGPKKMLPPPKALTSLPTPHKLKEDDLVFNPIDFAPPSSFRELQNGRRPDSPMGVQRPYSPSVRAFTPLASSFDALDVLPSPHHLRRSGTFTALDFAPPSKIRDPGNLSPSDAGSIRSNRSGISAMQHHAVRDGAYRVSRIPKEMVTTKDDIANQLRPKMNLVSKA
ncbi:hypothetical protein CB0940_04962 [Cercospora beticola]|uniref:Uncharacterized protein n=1 Tax=Cercospora beticola TaxID=122368 RepID=A0A2G5HLH0_CERBT|nr:hypothetical protein CB0940_04962 [Cercospora beticola]PIA93407.1 hypothetical protein CB0940_04962 [Cercospora beticola]WPB02249.1 hypothetical protein RHO25_006883 [Cercospora beticola]CAK1362885.1 unnamed protein product [Cercospora beticola]